MVCLRDVSALLHSRSNRGRARRACRCPPTVREDRLIATKSTASRLHGRLTCARSTGRSSSTRWSRHRRAHHMPLANVEATALFGYGLWHPGLDSLSDPVDSAALKSIWPVQVHAAALIEPIAGRAPTLAAILQCKPGALWRMHVAKCEPFAHQPTGLLGSQRLRDCALRVINASAPDCSPLPHSPRTSPPLAPAWHGAASAFQHMQR